MRCSFALGTAAFVVLAVAASATSSVRTNGSAPRPCVSKFVDGDWVAFCVACGFTQRYFKEHADDLAGTCPTCGGELRSQCPACGERFSSAFAVECEGCGAELRPPELFGTAIRKR